MWTYQEFSFWLPSPDALSGRTYPWAASADELQWRETDDAYYVEGKLPTFRRKDIAIEARGRELEVRANRERGIFRRERSAFRQVMTLPAGADPTDIDAELKDGELSIRIAKLAHARRRHIPIYVNGRFAPPIIDAQVTVLTRPSWLSRSFDGVARALRRVGTRLRTWLAG